jgi:hypothetical protein
MRIAILLVFLAACQAAAPEAVTAPAPTLDVLLWFDTEDYLLPASDDAALRLADFLTAERVPATFKVVGEKARVLERRGRRDVLAALSRHEIGYHSNWHSVHPTPAQYLSALGWDEGVAEFLRREAGGASDVERILGQKPSCYGQPGSSWGPQSFGALRALGIPVYLDAGSHVDLNREPLWYAGILTIFRLEHSLRTGLDGPKDLEAAKARFTEARERTLKKSGGVAHIYYHPCEWVHKKFWDALFADGANPAPEERTPPPQKTAEETRVAFETFETYVRWMKAQPGVRFLTARQALSLHRDEALGRPFPDAELLEIAAAVKDEIAFQKRGDLTLSAAEILELLVARLTGTPRPTLSASPLGPTEPSVAPKEPATASWSQVARTLADVRGYLKTHGRVPSTVWLGSRGVSPASFLTGLARAFPAALAGKPPATLEFGPAAIAADRHVAEDSEKLWGWLFPKGWHAPEMMALARLQAWTIKPAVRRPR